MASSPSKKKKAESLPNTPELIGSIIEKDITAPSSFPQPTVLPFPRARHRSHGPHWTPASAIADEDTKMENEGEDADCDSLYDPSFAQPIQRKEKKSLDFSRWKNFVNGNDQPRRTKAPKITTSSSSSGTKKEVKKITALTPVETVSEEEKMVVDEPVQTVSEEEGMIVDDAREPELPSAENGAATLMDDIGAENLARLGQMSSEEIMEAQAEITGKMDPALVEMLKKRGRDRLGKKKDAAVPDKPKKSLTSGASTVGDWLPPGVLKNRSWEVWRGRVEKVRELRFSLDGNVVEACPAPAEQPSGNKPGCSQYNVGNVAERDFLRTEGDPAALGYTINEAVALIRSMIPGQRAFALQLLTSVLNKALHYLRGKNSGARVGKTSPIDTLVDWLAVWSFVLGPEPQLVLSLRIALDDNHDSVVLSCAKAIQSVLSCEINENYFNIIEKMPMLEGDLYTAPVFRSRPEIDGGFLQGGFWKYNTKPSNVLASDSKMVVDDDDDEGQNTIQDDVVVAGQDVAAGLIRMGILPRICYILEMDPSPTLEECLVSVLIALARHSPTCANAVMRCPRLIDTVVKMFTRQGKAGIPAQIKATVLLKVLCQSDKQICSNLMKRGVFQQALWQWYRGAMNFEQWLESGREHCKITSTLMVEQLRLWKVCICYGYCVSYFADFFPAMCLWLSFPNFVKLTENDILDEFTSVTREAYLVLDALAKRLPPLHSVDQLKEQDIGISNDFMETWSWSHVTPMVKLATDWLALKSIPYLSSIIVCHKGTMDVFNASTSCMLWVVSAVLHMLCSVFDRIIPKCTNGSHKSFTQLPWLPQFVPKVGLEIVKNGFLNYMDLSNLKPEQFPVDGGSLMEGLCYLRQQNDFEASLSSLSCLHGLVRLVFLVDTSIQRARNTCKTQTLRENRSGIADKILEEGIAKWGRSDLIKVQTLFMTLVSSRWPVVQSVEMFGRGGPAPGIGLGWGSSDGGFWSFDVLLTQIDAHLILELFDFFPIVHEEDLALLEGTMPKFDKSASAVTLALQKVNSLLAVCLVAGPRDRHSLERALDLLLQAPILEYLSSCMQCFLCCNEGFKLFRWQYKEEDYLLFSKVLTSHFKSRWISKKRKSSAKVDRDFHSHDASTKSKALETIQEDQESTEMDVKYSDCGSLLIEWAHQRLPLPVHWLLSAICSIGDKESISRSSADAQNVTKGGLLLLSGLEAISSLLSAASQESVISRVSLVWKFHALSVALHASMDVLQEEKSKDVFETLQELYGKQLDRLRRAKIKEQSDKFEKHIDSSSMLAGTPHSRNTELLDFQRQVHENYTTFVENLIEQFGAISYGDTVFGRQVALYLHQSVEAPVRLAAWNALSNARVLELLPELEKCLAEPDGYLEPAEDDDAVLEAFSKSWISGALDRAAARGSISFTLALHHLSRFIFNNDSNKSSLRKKLAKSLLRSYQQKQHHEDMLFKLIQHEVPVAKELVFRTECLRRFNLLEDACDENSSLLAVVSKLKSRMT